MNEFAMELPTLSRGLVDRSENIREPEAVAAAWPTARVLLVGSQGQFPVIPGIDGMRLRWVDAAQFGRTPPAGAVLLGSIAGTHYWARPAVDVAEAARADPSMNGALPDGGLADAVDRSAEETTLGRTATIRTAGQLLPDAESVLATTAVALLSWHARAGFCGRCGLPTVPDATGHSRACRDGHQEFPRTDPAVIVLVHDARGNAILARQPSWDPGRFSVLAGFAEAGESLESTVAREIHEEVGVAVSDVSYLGSQPWPFPRSLMIAFSAIAPAGAPLQPRPGEIEQARWFSRKELRRILASSPGATTEPASGAFPRASGGAAPAGGRTTSSGIVLPGPVSIARRMIEAYAVGGA